MLEKLNKCEICPRECKINRIEGKKGNCGARDKLEISLVSLHMFEEPCISGINGSGTIFFSHCNLHCMFCQNYEISQEITFTKLLKIICICQFFVVSLQQISKQSCIRLRKITL